MSDASERFFDQLTRSFLPNHELAAHACSEMAAKLQPDQDEALEAAADRLEIVGASKWRPKWTKLAMVGAVLVVLSVLGLAGARFFKVRSLFPTFTGGSIGTERIMVQRTKNFSKDQQLLLLGDVSKSSESDRIKALWDYEPTNTSYFESYAIAYLNDRGKLPPDFLATAEKLDPENGWFHLLAAAAAAKDAVKQVSQTKLEKEQRVAPQWTILKPAQMGEALALLEKGCSKPRIQSYETELLKRRFALLPEVDDFQDSALNLSYVAAQPTYSMQLPQLAKVVSAQAAILAAKKDSPSFQTLLGNWIKMTRIRLSSPSYNLVEQLISKTNVHQPNPNFLQAAKDLGMTEEAAVLEELDHRLKKEKIERDARKAGASEELIERHSGILQSLFLPIILRQVANPPEIREADLTPGRRTDHALLASVLLVVMTIVLLLSVAGLAAYPFRHGELCRKLSRTHFSLLDRRDWIVLLTGGVLFPFLYFGLIRYLTPLGGLDWSLRVTVFLLPYEQFALLLLLVISTSLLLVQARVAKKLCFYRGLSGVSRVGLVLTGIGYVALPLLGLATSKSLLMPVLISGGVVLGLLLIWLLVLAIRGLFGRAHDGLERQIVARLMVPVLLFAALVNCAAMPLLHQEERHWVKQDRLFKPDPNKPAMTAYEAQVSEIMKAELLDLISPLESLGR